MFGGRGKVGDQIAGWWGDDWQELEEKERIKE